MSYTATISCLCLALIVGAHAAAVGDIKHRIRGGQDADIRDYPYQVSLRTYGRHNCGGSIISSRHVLTAAHCVHDGTAIKYPLRDLTVLAGSTLSTGKSGRVYGIEKIVAHEDWANSGENSYLHDIAVITLSEDIEFGDLARPIHLATTNVSPNARAVATGWGFDGESSHNPMVVLQQANMKILANDECERIIEFQKIYPGHVCAYERRGVGVCTADSGGPLVVRDELVGVTSWGMIPCGSGYPDVFASVYHYRDWILKQMEN